MIARRAKICVLLALIAWAALAFWNSVKPLPPGTHVASLAARLAESQAVVMFDSASHREILAAELAAIDRAEQMIVIDQSPVSREVAQHLLMRKRQRPNLKIVLVADPVDEAYGGTPAQYLAELEQIGIIVARVRLNRLRDPNALFSSLWRLSVAWWSDPFDEQPGVISLRSLLRRQNFKGDHRQLIVADDGSGGWRSLITGPANGDVGLELLGGLARDIAASELQIAAWSTGDDRLPSAPPSLGRGLGSIDARFLTEGAIRSALLDSMAAAGSGDEIGFAVHTQSDRPLINAALRAAARGTRLKILLDAEAALNRAVAGELTRDGAGRIEVHWFSQNEAAVHTTLAIVRRGGELTVFLGAMKFTRPSLEDFNLEAAIELRMPVRAAAARALSEHFAHEWSIATGYAQYADDSKTGYWRYRLLAALGLAAF
jgi:PLD-like domain